MSKHYQAASMLVQVKSMFEVIHAEIWKSEMSIGETMADTNAPNWEDRFEYMRSTRDKALEAFEEYLSNMYELERSRFIIETHGLNKEVK